VLRVPFNFSVNAEHSLSYLHDLLETRALVSFSQLPSPHILSLSHLLALIRTVVRVRYSYMRFLDHPSINRILGKTSTLPPRVLINKTTLWWARKSSKVRKLLKLNIAQPEARASKSFASQPDAQITTIQPADQGHPKTPIVDHDKTDINNDNRQLLTTPIAGNSISPPPPVYMQSHDSSTSPPGRSTSMVAGRSAEPQSHRIDEEKLAPLGSSSDFSLPDASSGDSPRSSSCTPPFETSESTLESVPVLLANEGPSPSTNPSILEYRLDPTSLHSLNGERENKDKTIICHMCILMQHDPSGSKANKCFGIIDSGSPVCLTWHKVMCEIGYDFLIQKDPQNTPMRSVSGHPLNAVGKINLSWKVATVDKKYVTTFIVLEDPVDREITFDFLLGLDWMDESQVLIVDRKKLPHVSFIEVDKDNVCTSHTLIPRLPGALKVATCP
jgi:hypothetical protein